MTLWEIMQSRTSLFIQKTFNRSARTSFGLFDRPESREGKATTNHSGGSRTTSYSSTCSSIRNSNGLLCNRDEPITLFRLELERLQYILHFPEEVAFQVALIKYSSNVKRPKIRVSKISRVVFRVERKNTGSFHPCPSHPSIPSHPCLINFNLR